MNGNAARLREGRRFFTRLGFSVNNNAAQAVQEYRYDALNRLTMAEEKPAAGLGGCTVSLGK